MLKLLKHANTRPIILLQTCKHATNHLIANMHVQRYQRYQHANTRPMRPLQTCKHANMRRYQGSRRYQRYRRSRRRKRHANQHPRDHAHANSSDAKDTKDREDTTRKLANETTLPTHAKACVITRDGPQVHAVQPRMPVRTISDARADSHTHMPVHRRCTQNEYQREATRYECNHVMHTITRATTFSCETHR